LYLSSHPKKTKKRKEEGKSSLKKLDKEREKGHTLTSKQYAQVRMTLTNPYMDVGM